MWAYSDVIPAFRPFSVEKKSGPNFDLGCSSSKSSEQAATENAISAIPIYDNILDLFINFQLFSCN